MNQNTIQTNTNSSSNSNAQSSNAPTNANTITPNTAADVTGFWVGRFNSDGYIGRIDFRLKQNGENLTVFSKTYEGGNRGSWFQQPGGKIKNTKITIILEEKGERVSYNGFVTNNTIRGTISFGGTWTAERQ